MKLIAFTGSMGSGKTTAIQHLKDTHLEKKIESIKFAGPLYDMQEYIYRRIELVYRRPQNFVKDRKLLQWLGTEWGRETINTNIWTDLWKAEVAYIAENYPHVIAVCDDCRFDNEAELVKSMGGVIVKLVADNAHTRMDPKLAITNHASEAGISEKLVDFTVHNNDTVDAFKHKLDAIYKSILK